MENKLSESAEDEQTKSVIEVVAGVLGENTKKNTFLQNVGIQINQPTSREQALQAELSAEKMENSELRLQLDGLSKKLQETEEARVRDREETAKKQAETDAKLDLVLSQMRQS